MRWLLVLAALAGCDRVFGLGDPYEDARAMGSDAVRPLDDGGPDGSHTPPALIASYPFDGDYKDAVSGNPAICMSMVGNGCMFVPSHNAAGSSASFDGTTCVIAQLAARPSAVTIALWVNATSGATETLLARPGPSSPTWLLQEDNDSIYFKTGNTAVIGTPGPPAMTWHAIAVTMAPDGAAAYLDGIERGSAAGIMLSYTGDSVYIGCDGSTSALDNFHGAIDNVEIFDGVLSLADIQAIP